MRIMGKENLHPLPSDQMQKDHHAIYCLFARAMADVASHCHCSMEFPLNGHRIELTGQSMPNGGGSSS